MCLSQHYTLTQRRLAFVETEVPLVLVFKLLFVNAPYKLSTSIHLYYIEFSDFDFLCL